MPGDFDLDTVPSKDGSIMIRRVKDEAYLVKSDSPEAPEEKLWVLNQTASFVWGKINGQRRCKEILDELIEQFDAEPDRIKEDFIKLLLQFQYQKLLTLACE